MQHLKDIEIFEVEMLDLLNSRKFLDDLYFGGGTMLRLCHNLDRYSTDLDFWLITKNTGSLFEKIKNFLNDNFILRDAANKKFTLLYEIKNPEINRSLKLEMRKLELNFEWERKIAFSHFSNKQVLVKGLTLQQMMKNKIEALLSRKIIRDCFDIEFLIKRGVKLPDDRNILTSILEILQGFKPKDFKVTLGSVLEANEREYYSNNGFRILKEEINKKLYS